MPSLSKTIALLFLFIGTCSAFNEMSLQSLHIRELLTVVSIGDVYVVTVDLLYNKCSHRHRFFFSLPTPLFHRTFSQSNKVLNGACPFEL